MAGEGRAGARGGRGTRGRGTRARGRGARGRGGASSAVDGAAAEASSNDAPIDVEDAPMNDAPSANYATLKESSTTQPNAASAPTASSSSSRPTPAPARGAGTARGRFMPRAIRRSQVDRESIAAKETAKLEDKAAQDARLKRATRGGRGGGRRARGGAPGGFFDRVISAGAGGFGSGIQATGSRGKAD